MKLDLHGVCIGLAVLFAGCAVVEQLDECPDNPDKDEPGICGCGVLDLDTNKNGVVDCLETEEKIEDNCPEDPMKTEPGICGCGVPDSAANSGDDDDDGTPNCLDNCPKDPNKLEPGECGCGWKESVAGESCYEANHEHQDLCPDDPDKDEPGVCGCGVSDSGGNAEDTDNDGTPNCKDLCPEDPKKTMEGACGCGFPDEDKNNNGMWDCIEPEDHCPDNPDKYEPGICGCKVADTPSNTSDSDGDGTINCLDVCPLEETKWDDEGVGGCEVPDSDMDGVDDSIDDCPFDPDISTTSGNHNCGMIEVDPNAFVIRYIEDFISFRTKLNAGNLTEKIVEVVSDINLADIAGLAQMSSDGCSGNWAAIRQMNGIEFKGHGHKITFESGGTRCCLNKALFDKISQSKVSSLILDIDVCGSGQALLANEILGAELSEVGVMGTLSTDARSAVGGIAGKITSEGSKQTSLTACYADGLQIEAPNAGYVGGLVGYAEGASLNMKGAESWISTISAGSNVGGFVGYLINSSFTGPATLHADEISGEGTIGGCAGYILGSALSNISLDIRKISASKEKVGGFAGYIVGLNKDNEDFGDTRSQMSQVSKVYNLVDEVTSSSNNIGGFVGYIEDVTSFSDIISRHEKVKGSTNVGGFVGQVVANVSTQGITFEKIQSSADRIEGSLYVGGVFGAMVFSQTSVNAWATQTFTYKLNQLSNEANVYATSPSYMGGLAGKYEITQSTGNILFNIIFSTQWSNLTLSNALYKLVYSSGTLVYKPYMMPTLTWNNPKNSSHCKLESTLNNVYRYSWSNSSEANFNTTPTAMTLTPSTVTQSNMSNVVTLLNAMDSKTPWRTENFVIAGSSTKLPIYQVQNVISPRE